MVSAFAERVKIREIWLCISEILINGAEPALEIFVAVVEFVFKPHQTGGFPDPVIFKAALKQRTCHLMTVYEVILA